MASRTPALTRREALKLTGGTVGALGVTSVATGRRTSPATWSGTEKTNVGYSAPSGRRAARNRSSGIHRTFDFDALTVELSADAARELRRRDDIRYVEEDVEMYALTQTLPWGIDRTDAEIAHSNGENGNGADVAIIDTGIDKGHPDLDANLGKGRSFLLGTESSAWNDDNGHGSHCAGIADALDNGQGVVGVSTEATLHAAKVLTAAGTGTTSDVAKGIEWTADQGYDVGSLSLGGGASSTLEDACSYAYENGVLLVAAAGNSGPCTDCVGYPAAYQECVAVSATTRSDDLADFSSTGPEVELAAPGEDIYSTYLEGTYSTLSGTSMACPHVSGAGGQLMANGYTNKEARQHLKDTAEDIGLANNEQGAGLLDVAAALGFSSIDDL